MQSGHLRVGTIVERILVVPLHVSHWSCKLWCPLDVEGKIRHVEASKNWRLESDSRTDAVSVT